MENEIVKKTLFVSVLLASGLLCAGRAPDAARPALHVLRHADVRQPSLRLQLVLLHALPDAVRHRPERPPQTRLIGLD